MKILIRGIVAASAQLIGEVFIAVAEYVREL